MYVLIDGICSGFAADIYFFLAHLISLVCECQLAGTVESSNVCDKKTGQCPCRKSLTGLSCTECKVGC